MPELGVRVDDRELDLVLVGAEVHEQLVDVVEHLGRPGVGAVDLVERDDDRQPPGHRLLEHVARLRQRALGRVDEQQDAVDHQQAALDLAAEVRVPGRVDDVEADAVDVDRRLLGEDRDPLLALEVARVHHPVDDRLVRAERAGLAEHRVDERGLAVVDVGDDGDVAEVLADGRGGGGGHGGAGRVTHGPLECRTCRRFGRTTRPAGAGSIGQPRGTAPAGWRWVGSMRFPSSSSITRSATSSITGSWVATTAVTPSARTTVRISSMIRRPGLGVQLARGLVREQQPRPVGEGAGDRDPLLLAARQLVRAVLRPRLEPDELEQLGDAPVALRGSAADEPQRDLDVLGRGQDRDQAERLEDERDRRRAERAAAARSSRLGDLASRRP